MLFQWPACLNSACAYAQLRLIEVVGAFAPGRSCASAMGGDFATLSCAAKVGLMPFMCYRHPTGDESILNPALTSMFLGLAFTRVGACSYPAQPQILQSKEVLQCVLRHRRSCRLTLLALNLVSVWSRCGCKSSELWSFFWLRASLRLPAGQHIRRPSGQASPGGNACETLPMGVDAAQDCLGTSG